MRPRARGSERRGQIERREREREREREEGADREEREKDVCRVSLQQSGDAVVGRRAVAKFLHVRNCF